MSIRDINVNLGNFERWVLEMLSAIVPITRMSGRLKELEIWTEAAIGLGIEVILVHDYQDQETEDELRALLNRIDSTSLELITKKVQSPGLARNLGLNRSKGNWITFWDSDDLPNPIEYLRLLENMVDQSKPIGIGAYTIMNLIDGDKQLIEHGGNLMKTTNSPGLWRYIFHKNRIGDISFAPMKMGEDQLFLANLRILQSEIIFSNESIYEYRIAGSSQLTSNAKAKMDLPLAIRSIERIGKFDKSKSDFTKAIWIRLNITQLKIGTPSEKIKALLRITHFLVFNKSRRIALLAIHGVLQ